MTHPDILRGIRLQYGRLRHRERLTVEERRALDERRVLRRARALARTNPAYRGLLGGGVRSLDAVPPLTKPLAAELFDELTAGRGVRREEAHRYLATAPDPAKTFDERHLVFSTSGSSGLPVYVVYRLQDFGASVASFYERAIRSRAPVPERLAYVGLLDRYNGGSSWMHHLRALMDVRLLDIFAPLDQIVQELRVFRPDAILTRPHLLRALGECGSVAASAKRPLLLSVGVPLARHEADEIARLWGAPPHNSYSTVETGPIGFQRDPHDDALDLYDDLSYVELLDDDDRPIASRGERGRIIVTPLYNRAFPLLRYEIGDQAVWVEPGKRLSFPLGRSTDALVLGSNGASVRVPGHALLRLQVAGVRRFRLVQTGPASVLAQYESADTDTGTGAELTRALEVAVRIAGWQRPLSIETEEVARLPIDPAVGKIKLIVPWPPEA